LRVDHPPMGHVGQLPNLPACRPLRLKA
jgi:hypothetical protein